MTQVKTDSDKKLTQAKNYSGIKCPEEMPGAKMTQVKTDSGKKMTQEKNNLGKNRLR